MNPAVTNLSVDPIHMLPERAGPALVAEPPKERELAWSKSKLGLCHVSSWLSVTEKSPDRHLSKMHSQSSLPQHKWPRTNERNACVCCRVRLVLLARQVFGAG
jgi:hypothetical protein